MNFYEFEEKKIRIESNNNQQVNQQRQKQIDAEDDQEKDRLVNNMQNMDMNEGMEKNLEEKLDNADESNKRMGETMSQSIEYDMRNSKREVKLKLKDKIEMEKMRRWDVKIFNVYITPAKEMIDPFVQFTIGGDYSIQVFSNKKGKTHKIPKGTRGFADKTEVLKNVDALERRPFDTTISTELRMSYSMINSQKMMVELWDYNSLWMNSIVGYSTKNLIDIVNGSMEVTIDIVKRKARKKRPFLQATVEFKCIFQEIWDYKITFLNWKLENILSLRQQKSTETQLPNLQLTIELEGRNILSSNAIAKSEILKSVSTPQFSNFNDCILFRGTAMELESQNLYLKLYHHNVIYSNVLSTKIVNLQGILGVERIKSDFPMVDPVTKDKFNVKLEGSMNIEYDTKYIQSGDSTSLNSNKKYLCINVQKVENIKPAETRGIVDSFISVEYAGLSLRTKTVKENNSPNFNEVMYFLVPMKEEYLKDVNKYTQKINEEFANKNEVVFNLMIEGDDNTYDNLGISTFHLSDLKSSGNATTKKFFADDLKKDKRYITRVYTGRLKLVSAFTLSNNTFVNFEAWFLDDFPDTIDFGQKKSSSEQGDKIPIELKPFLGNKKEKDIFYEKFRKQIAYLFRQYTNYSFKERSFFDVYQMDQYKNLHLLPYYLSCISLPTKSFTANEVNSNPLFFDYNLTTLDEIAHFVRCFPINLESKGEVWSSPDYVVKIRKGGLEDHAILMACLMLGLKKTKRVDMEEFKNQAKILEDDQLSSIKTGTTKGEKSAKDKETIKENDNINDKKTVPNPTKTDTGGTGDDFNYDKTMAKIENNNNSGKKKPVIDADEEKKLKEKENRLKMFKAENIVSEIFPYENRVFVCIGKLKYTRNRHVWVMTIGDDYRDITFWDPKMSYKFNLNGRIDDQDKLRNFLLMNYNDYDSINKGITIDAIEEVSEQESIITPKRERNDFEDKKLPYQNDSAIIKYDGDDDPHKDYILNEQDIFLQNYGDINGNEKNKNLKQALPVQSDDYMLLGNTEDSSKKKISFLEQQKQEMEAKLQAESDQFFLPVDEFKDRNGRTVSHTNLPYETLDVSHYNLYTYKHI